ncbi:MAG: tyrosine-type recombinase/integrase [Geminicoccales bacterium]
MTVELEGGILPPAPSPTGHDVAVPVQIEQAGADAIERFLEIFIAQIRNPNTRESYHRATLAFFSWCTERHLHELDAIRALHVSTYIEGLERTGWTGEPLAARSIKAHLAALKKVFDWLEVHGHVRRNPTTPVRGPAVTSEKGLTPALTQAQLRQLLKSIPVEQREDDGQRITQDLLGHRDRTLIAFMALTCARVGATLAVKVSDLQRLDDPKTGEPILWVRLQEKRGKILRRPCHPLLDLYLTTYLQLARLKPGAWLFQSYSHRAKRFTGKQLVRNDSRRMILRRAEAASLDDIPICNHSLRATGIRAVVDSTGSIETAQRFAGHDSLRTTERYLGDQDLVVDLPKFFDADDLET